MITDTDYRDITSLMISSIQYFYRHFNNIIFFEHIIYFFKKTYTSLFYFLKFFVFDYIGILLNFKLNAFNFLYKLIFKIIQYKFFKEIA